MNPSRVSFVIPTKNEENSINHVITSIRKICEKYGIQIHEMIITDDSKDKTRIIARQLGASIVIGGGKGLGTAMIRGLKHAAKSKPELIISIDADGQVDLEEIPLFLKAMIDEKADLVLGSRFLKPNLVEYKYSWVNRFGTICLSHILRRFTGLNLTDSHGGIRAWSTQFVDEIEMIGTHTYVQETIIDAFEKGFRIIEIPSRWLKREHGKSRVVRSIPKYVFYTLPVLILRSGNHIKYLFIMGILLLLLAILHIVTVAILTRFSLAEMFDRQTFVLFFILLSTGLNLFFFGVVLELLTQVKRKNS